MLLWVLPWCIEQRGHLYSVDVSSEPGLRGQQRNWRRVAWAPFAWALLRSLLGIGVRLAWTQSSVGSERGPEAA